MLEWWAVVSSRPLACTIESGVIKPNREILAGVDLVISCAPANTTVARVTNDYVFIHWPWRERDQSSQARWDGLLALPRDESSPEWANTPWRGEPSLAQ